MVVGGVLSEKQWQVNKQMPAFQPWSNFHPQYESHKQDHPMAYKTGIILLIIAFCLIQRDPYKAMSLKEELPGFYTSNCTEVRE